MGKVISGLFGGGQKPDNSAAVEASERSRKEQQVANDRQLASANREQQKTSTRRRAPRGRRLFEDGPGGLATSLGD